jgi:hypothetical protein
VPFSTYLNLFSTYLPTYLPTYPPINFINNNVENDFNLGIELTQSNGPLSTSQIVSHFINHFASQNDKVKINYLITLVGPNQLV